MTDFSADSISMSFGEKRVLTDVYVDAQKGEILGILGRNGSGKTTFYKCLLGLHRLSRGTVRIGDRSIVQRDAPRLIAWLPQDSYLPLDMKVARSARLVLGNRGDPALLEADARARELLGRRGRQLSTGERRYVECLLALSLRRPVILLDEPFSQIEPIYCEMLQRHVRRAAESAIVMISDHLYQNVLRIATRVMVIANGTLRRIDETSAGLQRYGYLDQALRGGG